MAVHAPFTSPDSIHARDHSPGIRAWLTHEGAQAALRVAAVTVAAISGAVTAIVMPRGPVTTNHALLLIVIGLAAGLTAAFLMRSRWAMLVAPVIHIAVFELLRLDETGPTVDAPSFENVYAILSLVLGRGVYILLGIFPMILGAAYGAGLSRWLLQDNSTTRNTGVASNVRRAIGALATVGMIAMVIRVVRPASVAPVTAPNGEPIDGSIAELMAVNLGGHEQWIEVRGASEHLPVLLYISGGPGQSDLALSRVLLNDLTRDFVMVGWDQRGNGKSYPSLDPESLTLDRAVADTIELSEFLCERFGQERIYLLGESWGTILGVLAAHRAPQLYYAYMGSGQMVCLRETDQIIYDDLLLWAETHGDDGLVKKLRDAGPPPYESLWMYAQVAIHYDKLAGEYDPPQAYLDRGEAGDVGPWGILGSEYTAIDSVNVVRGLADTFFVMYPQLQEVDFRKDIPALEMPVYLLEGEHELRGRLELAEEWFSMLEAPHKEIHILPNAGHAPAFEYADEFHRILVEEILPRTYPTA